MSEFWSIISSLTACCSIFFYLKQVKHASSTPNPATWLIVFVVISINTATYYFLNHKNIWSILMPIILTAGIGITIIYSFFKGRIAKVGAVEVAALVGSLIVGIIWKTTADEKMANLLMQVILVSSFIPTLIGLAKKKIKEESFAWNLAVISYFFLMLSVISKPEWEWAQLAYPFFNGIMGNGSVAILATYNNKFH